MTKMIKNLNDLCEYFGADTPSDLNRRVYKDTDCGASISVRTPDGKWHHNGDNWDTVEAIDCFTIQTIVEGSDATVDSDEFVLPVKTKDVDVWIKTMEAEAEVLWKEANEVE